MAAAGSRLPQLQKGLKLTKVERKIIKKQNKALHAMRNKSQEVGDLSDFPTPYLLVKNGGLMCGVQREDLFNVFNKYGKLDDLIMLAGKSYSYVLFCDVASSEDAMKKINGQKLSVNQETTRTFYLAYLLERPCIKQYQSDKTYPQGMIVIEDFISENEEHELLQYFSSYSEKTGCKGMDLPAEQQLKHRYVKHFGYEFIYGSNNVDKDKPLPNGIPVECLPVLEKLSSLDCVKHKPDQLTVNEYQPGQGIPPHVDTHSAFEDGIISLSLGAKVAMDFRHSDGRHISVLLPRRSVLIMTEECRYTWTHGITPRKYDIVNEEVTSEKKDSSVESSVTSHAFTLLPRQVRLSLTFRKIRRSPCHCKYPENCDSQNYGKQLVKDKSDMDFNSRHNSLPQSNEDAVDLEKEHVHDVYESIAEHFSGTRHSPWPKIAEFLKDQPAGSIVADVGCGNGKYLGINDQLMMFGSDRSQNLATICRERGYHVIVCDILSLPYRSNSFDVCICIAVIHHLSTESRRLAAITELTRIVRPGGRILISVWALEQNATTDINRTKKTRECKKKSTLETTSVLDKQTYERKSCCTNLNTETISSDAVTQNVVLRIKGGEKSIYSDSSKTSIFSKLSSPSEVSKTDLLNASGDELETSIREMRECQENTSLKLKVNATRNVFEQQDLLIPWHYRGQNCCSNSKKQHNAVLDKEELNSAGSKVAKVYQRFYHIFKENELANECRKLGNISIVRCYYDKGNWCVELEKLEET